MSRRRGNARVMSQDKNTKETTAYELNRDRAPAFWEVDILWLLLADGEQTGGTFSQLEQLCPKNSGPPPHTHTQTENFYILEGEITFLIDERMVRGTKGSFVTVPPDTVHSFRVDSETALVLNTYVPAGFELMITELGEPAPERTLPPPGGPFRHSPEEVAAVVERCGMKWLDVPDSLRETGDSRMRVTSADEPSRSDPQRENGTRGRTG